MCSYWTQVTHHRLRNFLRDRRLPVWRPFHAHLLIHSPPPRYRKPWPVSCPAQAIDSTGMFWLEEDSIDNVCLRDQFSYLFDTQKIWPQDQVNICIKHVGKGLLQVELWVLEIRLRPLGLGNLGVHDRGHLWPSLRTMHRPRTLGLSHQHTWGRGCTHKLWIGKWEDTTDIKVQMLE